MNSVNIGHILSYFGDQPFDHEHPEIDQKRLNCDQAVSKLICQLNNRLNKESRRFDLYGIIDLYRYRPFSRGSWLEAVLKNEQVLAEALISLEKDDKCKDWPEICEIKEVLVEVGIKMVASKKEETAQFKGQKS